MTSFDTPHCEHGNDVRTCRKCHLDDALARRTFVAEIPAMILEDGEHWLKAIYAHGMPDVPDDFTREDMLRAYEAGRAHPVGMECGWPACAGKATLREAALYAMLVGEGWTHERIDACLAARML